jgi:heme-degrading monooxygenase HmoA
VREHELYLIDGATEFAGPMALLGAVRRWPRLRRQLVTTPGYVAHRLWFRLPTTIGLFTWWETEGAAYRFARSPAHLAIWRWAAEERPTRGGWLALYRLQRGGPLWGSGVRHRVRAFGRFVPPPSGEPPVPPADA